jgi:hypothetical protein
MRVGQIATELEGTVLAPGSGVVGRAAAAGAPVVASIGAMLGFDTQELSDSIAQRDTMYKSMQRQVNNLLASGNLGEATNDKLTQAQSSLSNENMSPPAIRSVQADILEAYLEDADSRDIEVPNRPAVESQIEQWRSMHGAAVPETVVDIPAAAARVRDSVSMISRASLDQLQALDLDSLPDLSLPEREALLKAASDRWDELNAAE